MVTLLWTFLFILLGSGTMLDRFQDIDDKLADLEGRLSDPALINSRQEYQKVVKEHSKSDKVSIALLKQAYSFLNIGDKTSAKLLFKKIIREYPQSYSAGVAKQKLPELQ